MAEAARVGDAHTCPQADGPKLHVGGPVEGPGVATVLIEGRPAAVVGDRCRCNGPPDEITQGSGMVLIGDKPAARRSDLTAHGGRISSGCATVRIG
jgi:uncharacterized Zn-binding protein involved in type VI secretion